MSHVEKCFIDAVNNVNASGQNPMIRVLGPFHCGEVPLYLMKNHFMPDSAIVLKDILMEFPDRFSGIALKQYKQGKDVGISNVFPVLESFEQGKSTIANEQEQRDNFQFMERCKSIGINCLYVDGGSYIKERGIWNGGVADKVWIYDLKQSKEDPRLRAALDFVHVIN